MKKILAVVISVCCAFGVFAGCGSKTKKADSIGVDRLISEYGYQWEDASKPLIAEKGALQYKIYSSKNASALDYNDMKIMQDLYDQTNVRINWENVSESVYAAQKNLILGNAKNRPDAIYHAGMTAGEIIKYAKRNVLLPISDYLKYMPNFKRILEARPDIEAQITNVADGKIYALPRVEEMGLKKFVNLLFMNKTWLKEAVKAGAVQGVGEAEIADGLQLDHKQMEDALTYFKTHDMDGDGKSDNERPLSFVYNNWQGNQCDLYAMFGVHDNVDHRVVIDGKVTYTVTQDAFKDATNAIAAWVDKGLIDKVSFEQSQDQFLANGKTGTYGAFYWWESATVVNDPDNYICLRPLIGPGGKQTVAVSNDAEVTTGEFLVFADCPNPEVLLSYIDRYYDPVISAQINYGPIGIVYEEERDANGMLVQKALPADKTADEVRLTNAPLGVCYLSDHEWKTVVNMEPRARLRKDRLTLYAEPYVTESYLGYRVEQVPNLQFTVDELNTLSRYETSLISVMKSRISEWLLHGGVSDGDWQSFQSLLSGASVNLPAVQKVFQDAYNRYTSEK